MRRLNTCCTPQVALLSAENAFLHGRVCEQAAELVVLGTAESGAMGALRVAHARLRTMEQQLQREQKARAEAERRLAWSG